MAQDFDASIGFDSRRFYFDGADAPVGTCLGFDESVLFDADVSFDCGSSTTPPVVPGTPAVASIPGGGRRGPYPDELDTDARLHRIIQDEDILILL